MEHETHEFERRKRLWECFATCQDCGWQTPKMMSERSACAHGAKHARKHGHIVCVQWEVTVLYIPPERWFPASVPSSRIDEG